MSTMLTKTVVVFAAAITFVLSGPAMAGSLHQNAAGDSHTEGHGHGHFDALEFGEPGERSEVDRTIEVTMLDNYFEPEALRVRADETVRFVVKNTGEFLHEFNIGSAAMHAEHQEEMITMMEHGMLTATGIDHSTMNMDHTSKGMSGHVHDDPNSVLVEPGQAQELVWKFSKATALEFACNVPGHYDAGMMGKFEFTTKQLSSGLD